MFWIIAWNGAILIQAILEIKNMELNVKIDDLEQKQNFFVLGGFGRAILNNSSRFDEVIISDIISDIPISFGQK